MLNSVFCILTIVFFLLKRVKEGIRTPDPWNHNPMLYPTELLPPEKLEVYYISKPSSQQQPNYQIQVLGLVHMG
jgi:hypothetical protein